MKFLIVLLVVAFGIWLWRSRRPPPKASPPRGKPAAKAEMVRCAACGLHLPLADAERSAKGLYCSVEHRRQIEGR
jgi:uncharacterized protein